MTAGHGTKGLVTSTGEVYAWGINANGVLLQHMTAYNYPLKLPLENICRLVFGYSHYVAITHEGKVYTWG